MRGLLGRAWVDDTVVADDAHRVAVHTGPAAHDAVAVAGLELFEA